MGQWHARVWIASAVLFISGCNVQTEAAGEQASVASSSVKSHTLSVDGTQRRYVLDIPGGRADAALPLIIALHGGGGQGASVFIERTGLVDFARNHGLAVAFPEAIGVWNDGRDVTAEGPNDVAFIEALLDELTAKYPIDETRIYVTGSSAGGMFTLRLSCELTERFAAAAPVIASFPESYIDRCDPTESLPMLFINGTQDRFMPYEGGTIKSGRRRGEGGDVVSVARTVDFWVEHNQCASEPMTSESLPDRNQNDRSVVERIAYGNCQDGTRVTLVRIVGGGHTWPGSDQELGPIAQRLVGRINRDISANAVVWEFFQRFSN